MSVNYDILASNYKQYRIEDGRISASITKHIPKGSAVLNVGAGQGSYEPKDCDVTAIEPSLEMIAMRGEDKAPVIRGYAEKLPFNDNSFDVSLAILTIHHWQDIQKGLAELRRVTRGKIIILTWNGEYGDFWLPDYFPDIIDMDAGLFPSIETIAEWLGGGVSVEAVQIPHDCTDGLMCAYWRRPEMYLNAGARQAISTFSKLGDITSGLDLLRRDIESGHWLHKYSGLVDKAQLECGYRLVVHEC